MDRGASVPDQALAVPVEPVARLDPSGFDHSRDDMVFRVAEAIARSNILTAEPETGRLSEAGVDQLVEHFSTKCIPEARAAIAAMREPTDAMLLAVCPNHDPAEAAYDGRRGCSRQSAAASRFRAMIDAALASGMEAREGRDAEERLDGEAATARPDAQEQPLEPKY